MSVEDRLESKLADLQYHLDSCRKREANTDKEKELKEKVIQGLEKDIDLIQKQIKNDQAR